MMKSKEEIVKILKDNLSSVYCFNCAGNMEAEYCEDCHRKYMMWNISDATAEGIADAILREDK